MVSRRVPTKETVAEAAATVQRILAAVDDGTLPVPTPRDIAVLRRLQGALVAWTHVVGTVPGSTDRTE